MTDIHSESWDKEWRCHPNSVHLELCTEQLEDFATLYMYAKDCNVLSTVWGVLSLGFLDDPC